MAATSRELVHQALKLENPARAPRQLWSLPGAKWAYPREFEALVRDFPPDLAHLNGHYRQAPVTQGDPFRKGEYVDEWGCRILNVQEGIIGQVKDPLVKDWAADVGKVHFPREWLTLDVDAINRDCEASPRFGLAGVWARPFEQLQFIRGTADLYMDLLDPPPAMRDFMREMHRFYTEAISAWCRTAVDGVCLMDDWGSQRGLLISPALWREHFKPLYRDYIQLAHAAGKKVFFHSDGDTLAIIPELIELGVDALNAQIFCIGVEELRPFAGRITFWGEMDRQHLLPRGTPQAIAHAVEQVHAALWRKGGCIAQCEFGAPDRPENVRAVFENWDRLTRRE